MKRIFTYLFVVLLLSFVTTSAWAQLTEFEEGAVYRFVNRSTGRALNAGESGDGTLYVNATTVAADDLKQQWYVTKSGDYYVLRNLYYAKYLKGAITNKVPWSLTDYDSSSSNLFSLVISATSYNTLETKDWTNYGFMHDDGIGYNGGCRVVSWENGDGSNSSHWTIHKVEYTTEALKEVLEAHPTTEEVLTKQTDNFVSLFNEGACYTPKYSTLDEAKATAEYLALEDEIRELADKIYNKALTTDGWAEDNADAEKAAAGLNWDAEYAKKFRVQMYEPYSIAGDITAFLRMNAHANNDNPTGIYVPEGGVVYVMVEGEIKDGATLRLIDAGSNERITDATTSGYELNTGLNIIRYAEEAGMLYICYNVDTYDPNGESEDDKFPHKLSEYAPLKIHIEGGAINGFYSSCGDYLANKTYEGVTYNEDLWGGVDDDNDWIYMEERANLSVLPIISHRQILLFQLNEENGQQGMRHFLPESVSVPDTPFSYPQNGETSSWDDYDAYGMDCNITTGKINIWMETWDRIMHAELATLGLISEDDVNKMNEFYPRWKSDGTKAEIYDMTNAGPDGKTYKMFCNGRDYSEYYNHHGVSLGTTSGYMSAGWNAANYNNSTFGELMGMPTSGGLWGPVHEVGHQFQDVFNIRGATEVTNNVFSNAATWYQGISTSRYNGGTLTTTLDNFNSGLPFVDYNIWSMTQMFYKLWLYYHLAGNNTQFYPRFFEILRVDPLNAKGATATGTESMLKIYEKMCDASGEDLTEFFRAHGFFVLLDNYAKEDYGITVFTQTQEEVDAAIKRVKSKGYKENLVVILINDGAEATLRHDGKTPRSFFDGTENPEYGGVNDFIDGSATAGGAYTATVNSDGTMTMIGEGGIGFLVFDENGNIISFNDNSTFALNDEAKEAILTGNAAIVSVGSDINAEPVVAEIDLTAMQKAILGELIAKAQAIIDKIDNTYTKIGFYKGAAVADLAEVLAYAKEVYAASSGYEAAYDLLYAEYRKVLENKDAKIPFNTSLTYIITNKAYSNETMWVNSSGVVRSEGGVDKTSNDARWKFVETSTAGVYNIRTLDNKFIPAVQQSASMNATSDKANDDALYTLEEVADGVWAIKLSPAAGYRNLHSSWSNVVGWETGVDASRWYLTAVAADPVIADLADLEVYINKTEQLLDEVVGAVTYTKGTPLSLQTTTQGNAGYLWSNAPSTAEGSIANLVDGATNNHFHTDYTSEPPSGSHYLAVYLGESNDLSSFTFSHTTRSGAGSDFPKSVDVYGSNDNVTYKYIGSASGMPQSAGAAWEFDGVMLSSYKYLRFNYHAPRGYWHMAEFDITPVTGFTATVNDTYNSTVTVDAVTNTMNALHNGKRTANSISPTTDDVYAKLQALQSAYKTLYEQYKATIDARKATLAQLVTETETLISQVGTVELALESKLTLTTENLYCNAPYIASQNADYSAEYVSKLTDNNSGTYLHTRWNTNSDDGDYHYLRVDAGETTPIDLFYFTYTTASRGKKDMPLTMVVEGANEIDADNNTKDTFTEIATLTPLPEVLNTNTVYKSSVLGSAGTKYRYLRFKVTDITAEEDDKNGHPFFTMSEFGLTSVTEENVTVNNAYKSCVTDELLLSTVHVTNSSESMSTNALVTSVPMLDAQIADQQAAKTALEQAMAKLTVDKDALQSLYDNALDLYNAMADSEGDVNSNYEPSALTREMLATAKSAIDAAKDVLDNSNSQSEIDAAEDVLDEQYNALLGIKNANVATTIDKSGLRTAITNANDLVAAIEAKGDVYYESVAGFGLAELSTALQNAETVVDRFYLTEEQYTEAFTLLNNCYTTTNGIFALDCSSELRGNLATLIGNVNTLLTTIADGGENTLALPLQATNNTEAFYIWCNDPADDSDGVAGLIDKNEDGTANTGTFLGTNWNSDVPAYTHYIEIDLGEAGTIDQLTMDYTTRNSTYADQRPNAIKILGSNDKVNYTEITEITSGLAADANKQWSMAESLDLCGHYRYIRVAVGSQRGFFHMSDFNLYTKLSHTLKEYYTTAEGLDFITLCLALDEASDAAAHYMTTEQYTVVYNKLNGCYTTADGIVDNDYPSDDRDALAALKTDATALVNDVVTIDETETKIALQCTDANAPYYIYCNAPGATNNYSGDNLGVAALLDVDDNGEPITATFLHSSYVNGSHDDNLDHYLRVDMGEAMALRAFKFRYTPRIGNTGNAPLVMLIEGSNDCVNFEEITTLTDMTTTYQSQEITNGKAYRYIRFMVKDTHNHGEHDGHKFFAMSHFEMTACETVTISQEYASPNLPVNVAANAYNEVVDANALDIEHYLPSEVGTTAKDELQAAKNALEAAIALKNIPVKLTTDVNNPVLYKIKINRSATAVLQFDNATKQVAVASKGEIGNKYQAWYFMQGTDTESNDDILILPYWNEGSANTALRLGAASTGNATAAVWAVESGDASKTKQNWYITFDTGNTAEGWWNIRPEGKDNYFSNNGGVNNKMGFWNSSSDDGSEFQFVLDETDYSLSDAYYALYNQHASYSGIEVEAGTEIGAYTQVTADAFNKEFGEAKTLLEAKNSTDDEYDTAREELVAAYEALEINMPDPAKYYVLRCNHEGRYIYVNADNKLQWASSSYDKAQSRAVWQFEEIDASNGTCKMKSLHTQSYLQTISSGNQVVFGAEGATMTIASSESVDGAVVFEAGNNNIGLHAHGNGNRVIGYGNDAGANHYFFEEVEDVEEDIKHTVSLGADESTAKAYSTLYLAYNAQIPSGVTASIVEDVNELGQLVLTEVTGGVLPANTAVVLSSANAGAADFKYTANEATFNPQANMLKGTSCNELVHCGDIYNVYMLGKKNNRVAFYWTYENRNENGVKYEVNGSPNHNDGGYVLCNANKAYLLDQENPAQAAAAMYGFLFGGTAGVDSVNADTVEDTVYDLQGRKLVKVTSPGIYIVNGKKVYITEIED